MIKINWLVMLVICVQGCTHFFGTKELTKEQKDNFLYNFSSVNPVVESHVRDDISEDTLINNKMYLKKLGSLNSAIAKETYEALKDFDTIEIKTKSALMFVCVYSKKFSFGACDSTQCAEAEVRSISSPSEFEATFEKFSNFTCPTKSGKVDSNVSK